MEQERDQFKQMIDPSSLTTQQLLREISSLKELMISELNRKEDSIEGAKEAVKIAHDDLVRVPTEVQKSVSTLRDLHNEKFKSVEHRITDMMTLVIEKFSGVEKQFKERDTRTIDSESKAQLALKDALAAQKELVANQNSAFTQSVNKSEAATTKQIEGQSTLINTSTKGLEVVIFDLKERLTRIESQALGALSEKTSIRTNTKDNMGLIVGAIGIGSVIVSIIMWFLSHPGVVAK